MPAMLIDEKHLSEAERLLIPGNTFNEERREFIFGLQSGDLLAVPGSGKTTALMAKLFCLSRQMPFHNHSGLLVLAHTNASVNEIIAKLNPTCPRLFEYPNFVGTIQSFANKFLANNANFIKFGTYIHRNDDDIYHLEATKYFKSLRWSRKEEEPKNLINKLYGRINRGKTVTFEEGKENVLQFLKSFEIDFINRKIIYNGQSFYTYKGVSQPYYLELERWKESVLSKGLLCFADSFHLSTWYLHNYPEVKELLQSRFSFVFIDEMQDLEANQISLIESVFRDSPRTTVQRIGDVNQAIYGSGKKVKITCDWKPRDVKYLNGSNRLSSKIANLVNGFTLDSQGNRFKIVSEKKVDDLDICPHLIIFNRQNQKNLKKKFIELINEYGLTKCNDATNGFKIIGWTGKESENDKLSLNSLFGYQKDFSSIKEHFDSLRKHLYIFDTKTKALSAIRKSILTALVTILRLQGKKITKRTRNRTFQRFFTISDLIEFIKVHEAGSEQPAYEIFKQKLYSWSILLAVDQKYDLAYNDIRKFVLGEFVAWFSLGQMSIEASLFINGIYDAKQPELTIGLNSASPEDIKIQIETVHSVKGQTHCATMYVETFYHEYEINKQGIASALLGKPHKLNISDSDCKRGKEALKMMYVGFSRPTRLLCFALEDIRVPNDISDFTSAGWKIVHLND
ncbi:UvrD-helicase domain-containing protein [Dyadobacter fanqingshengii]|uniref:DNA 3'-5' helicase II n=1 Tax=Dyadobacter fanqingshengii TaxID=2906443 RepID=A0A9X1P7J7_9BACT|nr:UvrD-helicase domain-containing protein [Dyadobacter fanqingshengii]MCF0038698.1 UvrD-helicase domain-containing protein [Dyadobacter fanqingshengii]USJ34469.1 UvrD-helicase domain-containing protein [Dyadobacter fanqingshengii]